MLPPILRRGLINTGQPTLYNGRNRILQCLTMCHFFQVLFNLPQLQLKKAGKGPPACPWRSYIFLVDNAMFITWFITPRASCRQHTHCLSLSLSLTAHT